MRRLTLFIASGAYTGYIPVASGTWGTLVAFPVFWWLFDPCRQVSTALYLVGFAASVLFACWIAGRAETILQEHDSHAIVIDEIVGYLAATLFMAPTWENTLVAFLMFRVLDVIKPFPAGTIDRSMPGGAGVVLDDVVSGLYANLATRALLAVLS
jgi:phosphatidylglycerophosphatase A